jgi:hypothetical protein
VASSYVNFTNRNIFLSGKAGTGKTTFLKYIRSNSSKRMAVVAPTGVAAINAGGVTMHSMFQLPFGVFLPQDDFMRLRDTPVQVHTPHSLRRDMRMSALRRKLLLNLELLIIDEVSMVRADMLDAIDSILRFVRNQHSKPFGGVQMLFIGDLYQLPPVAVDKEWNLLKDYYASPFFFDAKVFENNKPVYVELNKIYRQKDRVFIDILNKVRNNNLDAEDIEFMNQNYNPDFEPQEGERYITLTSHNHQADTINQKKLQSLDGEIIVFKAEITGDFPQNAFPTTMELELKKGAQVMFIKNDKGEERKFYNGKLGVVKKLSTTEIIIQPEGENEEIKLEQEEWKNVKYKFNEKTKGIEEEILGSFKQYPIRLAWAVTIHKSQGLTFDKAIIDAGQSFAEGQVYVALSRLTSLEGLVLKSKIPAHVIRQNVKVQEFVANRHLEDQNLNSELEKDKIQFLKQSIFDSLDWQPIFNSLMEHIEEIRQKTNFPVGEIIKLRTDWQNQIEKQQEVCNKFFVQLYNLFKGDKSTQQQIPERVQAASAYFCKTLEEELLTPLDFHIEQMKTKKKVRKYLTKLKELKANWEERLQNFKQAGKLSEELVKQESNSK